MAHIGIGEERYNVMATTPENQESIYWVPTNIFLEEKKMSVPSFLPYSDYLYNMMVKRQMVQKFLLEKSIYPKSHWFFIDLLEKIELEKEDEWEEISEI